MITLHETPKGLCFSVHVQPRASKIAIVGCHQEALKIKLTAPPVGGAANKQCLQILAKALAVPQSALTITSGLTSRKKKICLALSGTPDPHAMRALKSKLQQLVAEKS
jgi:uncharacterized protein